MNNRDWIVKQNQLEKKFYFRNAAEAETFIMQLEKIASEENHRPEVEKEGKMVTVIVPVAGPDKYEEKDIRLANLINRIAN
jgi:pterin-4a-carbinolamine dehydratase